MLIKDNKNGFTLIETILFIVIFTLALGAISSFAIYAYRAKDFSWAKAVAIDNAQKGIEKISKEIREAIQSDSGTYLLESADNFEIIFYSDIDKDDYVERVRYFLQDETLKKGVIKPAGDPINYSGTEDIKNVSHYVKNATSTPLFYFYNKNYSGKPSDLPLTTPIANKSIDEVTLVGIQIEIDVNPQRSPEILTIRSKTQLRNTKQNY
jgi:type II secretory pathway pseudopilin PulG